MLIYHEEHEVHEEKLHELHVLHGDYLWIKKIGFPICWFLCIFHNYLISLLLH